MPRGSKRPEFVYMLAALEPLQVGESVEVQLPEGATMGRIGYQTLNSIAYRLWGAGYYKLGKPAGSRTATVTRLETVRPSPRTIRFRQISARAGLMGDQH